MMINKMVWHKIYLIFYSSTLYTVHCTCTLYTVHFTLFVHCTLYCKLYIVHCTVHHTLHTVNCTLYAVQCTLCTVHFALYTVQSILKFGKVTPKKKSIQLRFTVYIFTKIDSRCITEQHTKRKHKNFSESLKHKLE